MYKLRELIYCIIIITNDEQALRIANDTLSRFIATCNKSFVFGDLSVNR